MMIRTHGRSLLATISAVMMACSGNAASDALQDVTVSVVPALVQIVPSDVLPYAAFVTGTANTSVTWEVTESGGGSIDAASGLYTAPASTGVFHVVARSAAKPTVYGTAEVTVTTAPTYATGKAIGVNLSWWTYWDSQAFADTARQATYRSTANGFLSNADADGWPTTDFKIVIGSYTAGAYAISFTGQAVVQQAGWNPVAMTYDAATNTSRGSYTVATVPASGFTEFVFTNTRRTAGSAVGSGVTNLKIMRPNRALDVGTAATRFEPDYLAALRTFQWFRAMQNFGPGGMGVCGNTDVHWSDADAVAASTAAYQAGATYRFGDTVLSNGKVYLASFPSGTMSGAAGSAAPNHHAKALYDQVAPADGAVHWGRAARVKPGGAGSDAAGPAWEDVIMLANQAHVAPWFTIPYFASDLYITKLARLIKYGSDANGEPYTAPQATPVYPPLDASLPFVIEMSNEIWNSFPYPANYNQPLAVADYAAGNPWFYDSTNPGDQAVERSVVLAARMSLLFRAVFGDAAMMTRVRPVWAGQFTYTSHTATALNYFNNVWNSASHSTVNGYSANHPVSYYVYGIASAPYNDWSGSTVDALFASWTSNLTGITSVVNDWDTRAHSFGIKHLTYEGGNQQSSATITQAQADARYAQALVNLTHAHWNAPNGTGDVYAHFRMDCSSNNSTLGVPASGGDFVSAYTTTIINRNTPGWDAMRALRAETGR